MSWLFLALASVAIWGINNIIDKIVLDKYIKDAGAVAILVGLTGLLVSVIVFLVTGIPIYSLKDTFLILLSGIVSVFVFVPYFKALLLDEVSRVIPLFQSVPVFTLLMSYVFLGESLARASLIGFVLVFVGGVMISLEKLEGEVFKLRPAFWYMMLASFLWSLSLVLFRFVVVENDFWGSFAFGNLGAGVGAFILILIPKYANDFVKNVRSVRGSVYGVVAVNEGLYTLGRLLNFYAISLTSAVALVSVLEGVQPLFVLIYAALITMFFPEVLKEDISKKVFLKKLIPIILMIIGVYLMS